MSIVTRGLGLDTDILGLFVAAGLGTLPLGYAVYAASEGAAGRAAGTGDYVSEAQPKPAARGGPRLKVVKPRRKQRMHVFEPFVEIRLTAASEGAAGIAKGRATVLVRIDGKAASKAVPSVGAGAGEVRDVELEQFAALMMGLAA